MKVARKTECWEVNIARDDLRLLALAYCKSPFLNMFRLHPFSQYRYVQQQWPLHLVSAVATSEFYLRFPPKLYT